MPSIQKNILEETAKSSLVDRLFVEMEGLESRQLQAIREVPLEASVTAGKLDQTLAA